MQKILRFLPGLAAKHGVRPDKVIPSLDLPTVPPSGVLEYEGTHPSYSLPEGTPLDSL